MTRQRAFVLVTIAAVVPLTACELLFGIERYTYVDGDGGKPDADGAASDAPSADAELDVAANGCPSGRGPAMVRIGDVCIDESEVTQKDYAVFLNADAGVQPISCAWNTSYVPAVGPDITPTFCAGLPDSPQACVDWCDAYMYCTWAGKRLCGSPNGGPADFDAIADPAKSEWFAACSGDGKRAYPYGNTYDPKACHGEELKVASPTAVESLRNCQGSVPGLFDMSGNVWEWEDACGKPADGGVGPSAERCRIRGGSVTDPQVFLRCDADASAPRNFQQYNVGFRCCAAAR